MIVNTRLTAQPRKTISSEATIQVAAPRARDESWHGAGFLLQCPQEFTEVLAHHLVENGQFRLVA